MFKQRKIQFLLLFSILSVIFYCNRSYFEFNQNVIRVIVSRDLDLNKVRIYKGFYPSFNYKDEISKGLSNKEIIVEGTKIKKFRTDHGENDFIITYDKKYATIIRYIKTNNRECDFISLEMTKRKYGIACKIQIEGTDSYKSSGQLIF